MESKRKRIIVLVLTFAIVLAIPVYLVISNESHLANTDYVYKFRRIFPVDPHDAMRGKYMRISYPNTSAKNVDNVRFARGETVYIVVDRDSLGWAYFKSAHKNVPDVPNYFQTTVSYESDYESVNFKIDFDRYFINEDLAEVAEEEYGKLLSARDTNIYAAVTIKNGKALLNDLYYKEIPFMTYLEDSILQGK